MFRFHGYSPLRRSFKAAENGTNLGPIRNRNSSPFSLRLCNQRTCAFVPSVLQIRQNNKKHGNHFGFPCCIMEVPPRFDLGNKGFADLRLTAWLWHRKKWSGRRGSDSRPPPWQGGALPTELLPHMNGVFLVRTKRLELLRLSAPDPKSGASAIPPRPRIPIKGGDPSGTRTPDTLIKSPVLYQLS